jgi:hypothetical protein
VLRVKDQEQGPYLPRHRQPAGSGGSSVASSNVSRKRGRRRARKQARVRIIEETEARDKCQMRDGRGRGWSVERQSGGRWARSRLLGPGARAVQVPERRWWWYGVGWSLAMIRREEEVGTLSLAVSGRSCSPFRPAYVAFCLRARLTPLFSLLSSHCVPAGAVCGFGLAWDKDSDLSRGEAMIPHWRLSLSLLSLVLALLLLSGCASIPTGHWPLGFASAAEAWLWATATGTAKRDGRLTLWRGRRRLGVHTGNCRIALPRSPSIDRARGDGSPIVRRTALGRAHEAQ